MAKKKTALTQTLFRDINPYGNTPPNASSSLLNLPLTAVRPDPNQPRQLLPTTLIQQLANGQISPQEALRQWLSTDPDNRRLAELTKLADSIAQHGLINPITVRRPQAHETPPAGVTHYIITGERRYWSHVLLSLQQRRIKTGATQTEPNQIQALIAAEGISIRAHQLIENIIREDINAVEKAQGLWALRQELSGIDDPTAENSAKLVPWSQVSKALNISKRYRIYLTAVLNLTPEAQAIVTEHNLAEMTIRPIVQKLKNHPSLQLEALQKLLDWQEENEAAEGDTRAITKSVQQLVERLLKRESRKLPTVALDLAPQTRGLSTKLRGTVRYLNRLNQEDLTLVARDLALDNNFANTLADLEALQAQLNNILSQVSNYRTEHKDQ